MLAKKNPGIGTENEWILHKANLAFETYKKYFEDNEFSLALSAIENFFWQDFCDNYVELIKDQLMNPDKYLLSHIEATKWTLHNIGLRILQLYSPFVPHITETLYGLLYKDTIGVASIHQTKFEHIQKAYAFPEAAELMITLLTLISQVRRLKE